MDALILIVEDEAPQAEMLRYNLESEGYRVAMAEDGEAGFELAVSLVPDLAILDWMLPGMSGVDLCRRFRGNNATRAMPIVLLTARGEEDDRVQGLDSGADDYVVKPFSPREVMARVRALLRRAHPALSEEELSFGDITMDLVGHKVVRAGKTLHLGPTEFRLLRVMMERPGRVLSRDRLLDLAWRERSKFVYEIEPLEKSLDRATAMREDGPIILLDHYDNAASGGSMDTMAVLKGIIDAGLEDVAAFAISDPAAVQTMIAAGIGEDHREGCPPRTRSHDGDATHAAPRSV